MPDEAESLGDRQIRERKMDAKARLQARKTFWQHHTKALYICPDCGRGIESVDGFDVHHKDSNPRNNDPRNLVGLCKSCHAERHGQEYDPPDLQKWKRRFLDL